MPNWIADEDIWEKAKAKAAEEGHKEDWDYIMALYKKMGGRIREKKSFNRRIDWSKNQLIWEE